MKRKIKFLAFVLLLASCATVKKTVHRSSIDSTDIKETASNKISTASKISTSNFSYTKQTLHGLQEITLDTGFKISVPSSRAPYLVATRGNEQKIFFPSSMILEGGNIAASLTSESATQENNNSKEKAHVVVKTTDKNVNRKTRPLAFFLSLALLLFCLTLFFPRARKLFFNLIKKFL